ncbi:MAG: hypothetical protein P4L31_03100 [Candidatus Babeliales bacterium]|nr:hypothetical protein [Candidatus Babeliales bacterium]
MNKFIIFSLLLSAGIMQASEESPKREIDKSSSVDVRSPDINRDGYFAVATYDSSELIDIAGLDPAKIVKALWCQKCYKNYSVFRDIEPESITLEQVNKAVKPNKHGDIYVENFRECPMGLNMTDGKWLNVRFYRGAHDHDRDQAPQAIAQLRSEMISERSQSSGADQKDYFYE